MNVPRRHEPVATDTIFSDTPAVGSGVQQAQVFVGRDSLVADMTTSGEEEPWTSCEVIQLRLKYPRKLWMCSNWHSEPYHQNQNPVEWRYRMIMSWTNTVMNRSGAPPNCWLLCMIYVCYILNHIACGVLNGSIPLLNHP